MKLLAIASQVSRKPFLLALFLRQAISPGLCLLCFLLPKSGFGKVLTLDEYLQQVRASNLSIASSQSQIESTKSRSRSAELGLTPLFFSELSTARDEKEPLSILEPDKKKLTQLNLGLKKRWKFGLDSQVSYSLGRYDLERPLQPLTLGPTNTPNPFALLNNSSPSEYTEAKTQIDLQQSLLKNWGGKEIALESEVLTYKLEAKRREQEFRMKSYLVQAESLYWQLSLATEAVKTQEATLQRFLRIRDWAKNRVGRSLADKADLLQAEAGVKSRRLELDLAQRDRSMLQRQFNSLRNRSGEALEAEVSPLGSRVLTDEKFSSMERLDLAAFKAMEKASEIEVSQWKEKNKSELNLFGSFALNARDEETNQAAKEALSSKHPTMIIGLKFQTPLDRDLIRKEQEALVQVSLANRLEREDRELKVKQEWEDLQKQLRDARTRLILTEDIERAQKDKLDYEKQRLERGRTTAYQVLLFEQEFAQAQLVSLKIKAEILGILARLKTYGDVL